MVTGGRTAAEGSATIEVDKARPERDGSPVDTANLARIAAATGGKVIDPRDVATWPASAAETVPVRERVTLDLVSRSYLLILLALVAGADWLLASVAWLRLTREAKSRDPAHSCYYLREREPAP